ncbi:MAG: SLC45 family MFS transporter [Tissierellia bacterium]|nr:SLC45 family MFS transporter [Tissierellia bacterium]
MKLNYQNTSLIGFGFFASSLVWAIYNSFVPLLLEERFLLTSTSIGLIMTIDNFFGVIFQPLIGSVSDKTVTARGRRMPWIIVGLPLSAIIFTFIPRMYTLFSMMLVIITFNILMSLWRAPVIALMPDVTPKPLRSKANGVINLMGGIGSITAFLLGGLLAKKSPDLSLPFLFATLVMFASLVALIAFVREPVGLIFRKNKGEKLNPREDKLLAEAQGFGLGTIKVSSDASILTEDKKEFLAPLKKLKVEERRSLYFLLGAIFFWFCGFNAIETFFTLYATKTLGMSSGSATMTLASYSLAFLVFALPSGILAEKFGRKPLILTGLVGIIFMFIPLLFIQNTTLITILLIGGGVFWACININSLPMVVEMTSEESLGSFTGYYYFFSFSASIVSPVLFGWIRDLTQDYTTLFAYSVIAFCVAFVLMIFVKHGDNYSLAYKKTDD